MDLRTFLTDTEQSVMGVHTLLLLTQSTKKPVLPFLTRPLWMLWLSLSLGMTRYVFALLIEFVLNIFSEH